MNWFLNTAGVDRNGEPSRPWPAAPESVVMFRGAGANIVYVDRENDVVAKFLAAADEPAPSGGR